MSKTEVSKMGSADVTSKIKLDCVEIDGTSVRLVSSADWDYYGNGGRNHTFTVNIKQVPVNFDYSNITLTKID